MINLEHAIWDIEHIRRRLGDESQINIRFLVNLIGQYRAKIITDWHNRYGMVQSDWVQKFYDEASTRVDNGDLNPIDPDTVSNHFYHKVRFPGTLTGMKGNFGIVRIHAANGTDKLYETTRDQIELMIQCGQPLHDQFNWYYKEGDSVYLFKYSANIGADLILNDPFEGYIWRTENIASGRIKPGERYIANDRYQHNLQYTGTPVIMYNGRTYSIDDPFVGVEGVSEYTILISNVIVGYETKKKMLTIKDPYPLDSGSLQDILWTILTKDLLLEAQAIQDVIGDNADTLNLLKQDNPQAQYRQPIRQ
jgi:hypothetical protein